MSSSSTPSAQPVFLIYRRNCASLNSVHIQPQFDFLFAQSRLTARSCFNLNVVLSCPKKSVYFDTPSLRLIDTQQHRGFCHFGLPQDVVSLCGLSTAHTRCAFPVSLYVGCMRNCPAYKPGGESLFCFDLPVHVQTRRRTMPRL